MIKNLLFRESDHVKIRNRLIWYIAYLMLFLVFCFFTFYRLGESQIENWDEARHGISAYEMIQSGDYIKNTYCYETDLWNLKPPLSFWTIAASYRMWGYNTFALRLPSAMSFTIMFVLLSYFIHRRFGYVSTIVFMVLFTSYADLFLSHFGRHADADAVYNMLYVASMLSLFCTNRNLKMIYVSVIFASLAFLTKSFHAAALFAVIAVYVVIKKETRNLGIMAKLIVVSATPILLWMCIRFCVDGFDFIGSMFGVDVVNRINDSGIAVQAGDATTMLHYIMNYRPAQILLLIISFALLVLVIDRIVFDKNRLMFILFPRENWLFVLWIFVPCLVFELSSATPTWYYYPTVIGLIVIASALFGKAITMLGKWQKQTRTIPCLLLLMIIVFETGLITVYSVRSLGSMYNVIKQAEASCEQKVIKDMFSKNTGLIGKEAYILKNMNSYQALDKWEQRDVLAAELYADLHCKNGGIRGFMDNPNSILMISHEQYEKNASLLSMYRIVCEDESYCILTH